MKNKNQLSKKLDELEKITDENNQARIIIYDPLRGPPVIPDNNTDSIIFLIPDNGRDHSPVES